MSRPEELFDRVARLEEKVGVLEDRAAIDRLQYVYGFYLDNRMWRQLVDLFCDDGPEVEIGRRGRYVGKDQIHRFFLRVLGGGRWGLLKDELINHIQLQQVITVATDRRSAQMRSRAVVQGNSPPGGDAMLWAEGLYENNYVLEGGVWKIKRILWVPTFYATVPFTSLAFQSGPVSEAFPPDRPSLPQDEALGRSFLPFHYHHPVTQEAVPSPSARRAEDLQG